MNVAILLAGGEGKRMKASVPKQFAMVCGKPLIAYTLEQFQTSEVIDAIEVVCKSTYMEEMREIVKRFSFDKVRWVVKGGNTYQESVISGIEGLDGICVDEDIALIHFGASPFVKHDIIEDSIRVCQKHGNAVSCNPCTLCLCEKDTPEYSTTSVIRENVLGLSSPQTFKYGYIKEMYEEAERKSILDKIDPHTTSLMFALGRKLYFSKGSLLNIKITQPEELELFKAYVMYKAMERSDKC